MGRRRTLAAAVAVLPMLALLTSFGAPGQAGQARPFDAPDSRPNIIFILSDDQRASDLAVMPRVSELLAAHGTSFSRAYAPFPICCPARASILTGQHAHNHGVLANNAPLGGVEAFDDRSTLATWLQDAGYQTAFVGKYLNNYGGEKPVTVPPGWTEWHGAVAGGNYFNTLLFEDGEKNRYADVYQTDLYRNIATDIIERRVPREAPLFLFASYFAPHQGRPVEDDDPIKVHGLDIMTPAVAPRHRDVFANAPLPKDPSFNELDVSDKPAYVQRSDRLSPTMQSVLTEYNQQRWESLLALDEAVAEMMQALAATGELDNTIVIFTSDNGYMLGEHRIEPGKRVPYEPSARVPLIARGPGFPAGVERTQPVALIDLAPTLVEAAQATAGLEMDGLPLQPVAADPSAGVDRDLLVEAGPGDSVDEPWFYRGVRSGPWLYVEYGKTGEIELYDMVNDPYQLNSLHAERGYKAESMHLARLLADIYDCAGAECH